MQSSVHSLQLQNLKQEFDRQGFVIIRNFLSLDEVAAYREHGDAYVSDVVPTLSQKYTGTTKSLELHDTSGWWSQQLHREEHLCLMSALLGDELDVGTTAWNDKPYNSEATRRHQDSIGNPTAQGITLWVALDTADEENGCLHYGAGSHKCGILPNLDKFFTGCECDIPAVVGPGDAVLHHSYTVHWTDANRTSKPRRAYTCFHWGRSATASIDTMQLTTSSEKMPVSGPVKHVSYSKSKNSEWAGAQGDTIQQLGKLDFLKHYAEKLAEYLKTDVDSATRIVSHSMQGDEEACAIVKLHKAQQCASL